MAPTNTNKDKRKSPTPVQTTIETANRSPELSPPNLLHISSLSPPPAQVLPPKQNKKGANVSDVNLDVNSDVCFINSDNDVKNDNSSTCVSFIDPSELNFSLVCSSDEEDDCFVDETICSQVDKQQEALNLSPIHPTLLPPQAMQESTPTKTKINRTITKVTNSSRIEKLKRTVLDKSAAKTRPKLKMTLPMRFNKSKHYEPKTISAALLMDELKGNVRPVVKLYDFAKTKVNAKPINKAKNAKYSAAVENAVANNNHHGAIMEIDPYEEDEPRAAPIHPGGNNVLKEEDLQPSTSGAAAKRQQQQQQPQPQTQNSQSHNKQPAQQEHKNQQQHQLKLIRNEKFPPLFLPDVEALQPILDRLSNTPGANNFTTKCTGGNSVRVHCTNLESYNAILTALKEGNDNMHTHQLRSERGYRVILRHLHRSTPREWIRKNLGELGFVARHIAVIKHHRSRHPMNLFEVELEPRVDGSNDRILSLTKLGYQNISVERQMRRFDPIQCHRCQVYGHTKNYCRRPFVCVKCAGSHPTVSCSQAIVKSPKCSNCEGPHVANYKGCPAFRDAQAKLRINRLRDKMGHHHQPAINKPNNMTNRQPKTPAPDNRPQQQQIPVNTPNNLGIHSQMNKRHQQQVHQQSTKQGNQQPHRQRNQQIHHQQLNTNDKPTYSQIAKSANQQMPPNKPMPTPVSWPQQNSKKQQPQQLNKNKNNNNKNLTNSTRGQTAAFAERVSNPAAKHLQNFQQKLRLEQLQKTQSEQPKNTHPGPKRNYSHRSYVQQPQQQQRMQQDFISDSPLVQMLEQNMLMVTEMGKKIDQLLNILIAIVVPNMPNMPNMNAANPQQFVCPVNAPQNE